MKKNFTTILLLYAFVSAFGQDITQTTVIHFDKKQEKNSSSSIHPELLKTMDFFKVKRKQKLQLSNLKNWYSTKYKSDNLNHSDTLNSIWHLLLGISYGPETVLSIPKFGILNIRSTSNERLHYYYGGEINLWIYFAVWWSAAITSGVKYGVLTLETNFSTFLRPRLSADNGDSLGPYLHTAFNPKIGLHVKGFWFRFGSSFILYKKYDSTSWQLIEPLRRGELQYNFELIFIGKSKK